MKTLGAIIREKRTAKGLKIFELARQVDVNAVYISQIEKHNKLPSQAVIERIEKALDTNLFDIYIKQKNPAIEKRLPGFFSETRRQEVLSQNRPAPHFSLPNPVDSRDFPRPEEIELARFVRQNATSSMPISHGRYADLLKEIAPGKPMDDKLFDQVSILIKDMQTEHAAYRQKFIAQTKHIASLIIPPKPTA